ncbi:MAG TPA: DUF2189 domain-containing protein [Thiothrix sp.]|nr:DUF2189 domain-containing protein [Thiothrix sp.]
MPSADNTSQDTANRSAEQTNEPYTKPIEIRTLDSNAPMRWLRKGIDDFKISPMLSLFYGSMYTILGLVMIATTYQNPIYVYGLVTIFYLVGPIIAVGLYCMSRHIEAGVKPTFGQGCTALCYNPVGIVSFAIIVGMLVVFWTIIAATIIALVFSNVTITDNLYETILANKDLLPFAGLLAAIGLVFAVISFSISVISIPLMTHRKVDVVTAIISSVRVVKQNPGVMLSWGIIIVTVMFLGFAFAFIGIAVALPVIGHATWHAYREVIIDHEKIMTADKCDIEAFPFFKGKI